LVEYLKIQRDSDAEVVRTLTAASERINTELIRLGTSVKPGKLVRGYQLRKAQAAIHRELATTWTRIGDTVQAGRDTAMARAVELSFPDNLLANVLPEADREALLTSLKAAAGQGIVSLEHRLSGASYRPLATSVYHNTALAQGHVDRIVNNALARGASARELAIDVKEYIRPDVRGGMHYAAMRLARTEINNAFHAQQVLSAQKNPMITGVRWNLSGSHPKPDECNDFADIGIWRPEEVPGKPHPHCLCYMTDELPDRAAFIKNYTAGDYDSFLTEAGGTAQTPEPARRVTKPRTPRVKAPKAPTPAPEPITPTSVATPEPVAPVGEAGAHLAVVRSISGDTAEAARHTLDQIAKVHRLPTSVERRTAIDGVDWPEGRNGEYDPSEKTVRVSKNGRTPLNTTAHEFGHSLDFELFGDGGNWGTKRFQGQLTELIDAIHESPQFTSWNNIRKNYRGSKTEDGERIFQFYDYMTDDIELFARAYSQWITVRSGDARMLAELDQRRETHWSDEAFEPIGNWFDTVFRRRGLLVDG
jgi:hypothetical protein